ncbi:MAG: hypothetical protein ACRCS9_16620, partial [Hyphomicrobium sp.]
MRREVALALSLAVMAGVFSAAGIANWMSAQKDLAEEANRSRAPGVELTNIVVTKENLNFGTALVR